MTYEQFEDLIEQGYWEFDNLKAHSGLSDRDKFKNAMRIARNKVLDNEEDLQVLGQLVSALQGS